MDPFWKAFYRHVLSMGNTGRPDGLPGGIPWRVPSPVHGPSHPQTSSAYSRAVRLNAIPIGGTVPPSRAAWGNTIYGQELGKLIRMQLEAEAQRGTGELLKRKKK